MGQAKRDTNLENRTNRLKLPARKEPYWSKLGEGETLGYYRPASRAAGSWQAKWRDPETGARKKATLGTADDYADVNGGKVLDWSQANRLAREWFERTAREAIQEAGGEVIQTGPYTVADALRDYFEDGNRRGVKGLHRDESRAAAWITPALGPLPVAKLTRRALEAWLSKLADSPRRVRSTKDADKPAFAEAPSTPDEKRARKDSANRVMTVLKAALNFALDRRRVATGEAWKTVKPYRGTTSARIRFLSPEDQVRLVNACPPDFKSLVQGALLTGARYGELTRLRVEDFDATARTIFIAESKSGKSRHVVLTDEGRDLFTELTAGRPASAHIFLHEDLDRRKRADLGNTWGPSDQSRLMEDACAAAGLDPLTFHELRHTYASGLVNRGVPLVFVAAQLGHADIRMVQKHYGHLAPSALADSIRALMPRLGLLDAPKVAPLKIERA